MIQQGTVVDKKEDMLTIKFQRGSACGNCKGCSGKDTCLTMEIKGSAEIGDEVKVEMPQGQVAKASLLAYGIPLVGLFAGFLLGQLIGKSELASIIGGVIGLGASSLLMWMIDQKVIKKNPKWAPRIVEVVNHC